MEKYEISLWENVWVEDQSLESGGYYDENKICVIGADDMNTPVRAIEPKLVDNINGTHTFTFKMYKRYVDNITGETVLNPFDKYLTNERKVKVFWKGYWYDFIIKKIQENNSDKSLIYTCQDLFIYELSKNGYELNFDTDLKNNIGSARKLIKATLDGSTWQFDEENSEEMIQTYEEPVIEVTSLNNFETINQTQSDTSFTVQSNKKMLVFYNSIIDIFSLESGESINRDIQLICDNTNTFITELNNNLVIDNYCLLAHMTIVNQSTYFDFKQGNTTCFQLQNGFQVSSNYRGERFINTDIQVYDDELNRYVVECEDLEDPNHKVYRTEITEDNNPLKVVNLISNPTDFKNTEGWEPAGNNNNSIPLNIKVYPDDFPSNIEYDNFNVETALKIKGKVYNNGFMANANKFKASSYEKKQGQLSGIQEGEQFTFRIRGFKNQTISESQYVFPEIDRTPIEVVDENEISIWDKMPLYIYEDTFTQYTDDGIEGAQPLVGGTDTVGRVLSIGGIAGKNSTFSFGVTYKIVSYNEQPIKFGLNASYENNKLIITNRTDSTYGILGENESVTLTIGNNSYYNNDPNSNGYTMRHSGQGEIYRDYCFTFLSSTYKQLGLILYDAVKTTSYNGMMVLGSVTTKIRGLTKPIAEIFGPQRNNRYYQFLRSLLKRAYQDVETDSLNDLNRRTFTDEEMKYFYGYEEAEKYHPNGYSADPYHNYYRIRTYILGREATSYGHTYYPDFSSFNGFYVFVDPNRKGFQLLFDNVAEQIAIDPPLLDDVSIYTTLVNSLAAVKRKNYLLQKKANNGYYYINRTAKNFNLKGLVSESGPNGTGFTSGQYVMLITTIKDNIYDSETNKLVWDNYQIGDYVAHLYKCEDDTANFDEEDTEHWTYLDKTNTEFPLLTTGESWRDWETVRHGNDYYDYEVINEDVLNNSRNQYGYWGTVKKFVTNGYKKVTSSEIQTYLRSLGIPASVNSALNNSGIDINSLSDTDLQALKDQIGEALGEVSDRVEEQLSMFGNLVYSLGAYVTSMSLDSNLEQRESQGEGLQGEFDKLLLNTFQPIIPVMEKAIASYFDSSGEFVDSLSSVEESEINRYVNTKIYDSDFPNLSSFIESSDYTFNILLDGDPVFSCSEPTVSSDNWIQYTLTCIKTVPLEEIKNIDFFLNTANNQTIWLDNVQLFKNQYIKINNTDVLIYPGKEFQWSTVKVLYMYYEKTNDGIVTLYTGPDLQSNYPSKTSNYYKIATININRSNRFNILQTIAEAFNGWIYFDIKHDDEGKILLEDGIPKKYVGIQQKKGNNVDVTFEYGIDLKQIQRSIDSNQLTTKVYVLQNSNEFGKNGFCTISRSRQNLTKASFILDFDYFIQNNLIDEGQLNNDLYGWYYPQMNRLYSILDTKENELIDYKEKILRLQAQLTIYENYISAAEDNLGSLMSDKLSLTKGFNLGSNKKVQSIQSSISSTQRKIEGYETYYNSLSTNVSNLQGSIDTLEEEVEGYREALEDLHKKFNNIYWPFIFEGTWIDEKYIDDDRYYLDGLMVAHNSSRPQLTYNINVIRVGDLPEFTSKQFHVGDICYIVDKEFFGFKEDGVTPIKERIIVYEITSYFDSPEKDSIMVRNYRSKFDDLFQKIVATTQSLKFAEGEYTRVAKAITPERTISYDLLQDTFSHNENIVLNAANQSVTWDETGITITNDQNTADKTRIIAGGIFITNDGGKTWKNAVRGDGISADILTAGRINSGEIYIYDKEYPMFRWDNTGISAYSCTREEQAAGSEVPTYTVNFSKFVRFDKFGLYGYSNPSNDAYLDDFIPQSEEDIWTNPYTKFGLTWKGFFLKSTSEGGGYVKITTDGDLIKYSNGVIDRKIISSGIMDKETFYLTQNGNAVFSGELKAARGSFVGDSNTSLLTLDNNGLVLKVLNENNYQEIFRIEYIYSNSYAYPYLEMIGETESSIIIQNKTNMFIGPKNFIGLNGITIGTITVEDNNIDTGVFVDVYYKYTNNHGVQSVTEYRKRTYNIAKALFGLDRIFTDTGYITDPIYAYDREISSTEYNFLTKYIVDMNPQNI